MKPRHIKALSKIITTNEDLQAAWNEPVQYKFMKNRIALVTLLVAEDKEGHVWNAAVRICRKGKAAKPYATWTIIEKHEARKFLLATLDDVGLVASEGEFFSPFALHLSRKLTPEELGLALLHHLLGN
jgi:hypothetical protein